MLEYGVNRKLVKRVKEILRNGKGRKMTERCACDVCRAKCNAGGFICLLLNPAKRSIKRNVR